MAEFLYRIGGFASRRSGIVIVAWVAILALAGVAFAVGGGHLANGLSIPGTPTAQVTERLATEFPAAAGGNGSIVFRTEDGKPFTDAQKTAITARIGAASDIDGVTQVVDPFATQAARDAQAQQTAAGQAQLDQASAQLDQGQAQLDAARAQAKASGTLEGAAAGLAAKQTELDQGKAQLDAQRSKLEAGAALLQMSSGIRLVSEDGSAAVAPVMFTATQFEVSPATKSAVQDAFSQESTPGVAVDFSTEIASGIPSILGGGELVGLVIAAIVLIAMLGTLVGAGLPILSALVGVGIGVLAALSLSGVVEMVSVTPVLGVMLGLAVGIDYSLFIVNRHRRQLKEGYGLRESISLATGTSGNAVVFAGMTVVIALLGLNVTGIPFLGVMGTVGAICVAIAVLIAVTFTPAMLGLMGERVLNGRERAARASQAAPAVAKPVRAMSTRRAIGSVLLGVAVLGLLAVPAMSMRLGLPDGSSEASGSTQYQAYTTVAEKFGAGVNGPLLVVADLAGSPTQDEVLAQQVSIGRQLAAFDDVVAVAPIGTSTDGTTIAFQVVPSDGPSSVSTEQLVKQLRAASPLEGGVQIAVAGQASGNIDISQKLADALPLYLALVVGLSLLIMVVVFRSIFVPLIATGGFMLSLFAAFGAVVAIFQWGALGGILGIHTRPDPQLPANHPGRHPVRPRDGLHALPHHRDAGGIRPWRAGPHGRRAGRSRRAIRRRGGRDHHGLGLRRVHLLRERDHPGHRFRARHRCPPGRVRRAHVHRPVADAPRRRLGVVAAQVARPPHPERRRRGRVPRTAPPARGIGAHRVRGRRDRAGGVSRRPGSRGSGVTTDES